jgi:hypothetical protein
MEVPAKRARLAPRELELLDLHDYALFEIIDYLDHDSKLKLMLTCKRFEGLIGQTHQFYKDFQFRYNQQQFLAKNETRYLEKIRRRFETVEISSGRYMHCFSNRQKSLKPQILEFLKKIGAHIHKIKFDRLFFYKSDFWELLKILPKIRELEFDEIQFSTDSDDENFVGFKLENLTKLQVSQSAIPGFFATLISSSLKIFKFCGLWGVCWAPELLEKQISLQELSVRNCQIKDFQYDPENCRIKKVSFRHVGISNPSAIEKICDFLKIQESLTDFEFRIYEWLLKNPAGLLVHLLSLKTLKKLTIGFHYQEDTYKTFSNLSANFAPDFKFINQE